MIERSSNGLRYFEFETFQDQNVSVRFYSRQGGVSPAPWNSLNQGGTVGDSRDNVVENRKRIFGDLNRPVESIYDVWQVHGNQIIYSNLPRDLNFGHQKADAIFTENPDVTLFMRFADCVPIVLYAAQLNVIGIVHAGWMGTVNGIVKEAVSTLQERYAIDPQSITAGIGPAIGPDHYQVGPDVEHRVIERFGEQSEYLLSKIGEKVFFNLWKANELLLRDAGVSEIECAEICTACNTQDWYSHRQERGKTGRFAAVAFLK
jgi:hypothetical protein